MTLFPTFAMPAPVANRQPAAPVRYPRSWQFDFVRGDFVLDGSGRVVLLDGHRSWAQWCVKTTLTQRGVYLAYSRNHGVDLERAIVESNTAVAEVELVRSIQEALLRDPRTRSVTDFAVSRAGDELTVSYVATPTIGSPVPIDVTLGV